MNSPSLLTVNTVLMQAGPGAGLTGLDSTGPIHSVANSCQPFFGHLHLKIRPLESKLQNALFLFKYILT